MALTKPSEKEEGHWYFQRYVERLPTSGELTLFDRSWYTAELKCGSPDKGGLPAEYATVYQAHAMHPDAVALLGDEQYEVGKLSDFENSFEQARGGLRMLDRPRPATTSTTHTPSTATTKQPKTELAISATSTATTRPAPRTSKAKPVTTPPRTKAGTPTTSATGT